MFEDVKGVLRSSQSKKDRQYNDQKKKTHRRTNNDLQNTTQKIQNWTKTAVALVCSQKVSSSCCLLHSSHPSCNWSTRVLFTLFVYAYSGVFFCSFCFSSSCVLCTQCCQFLLDCPFLIAFSVFSNVYL
jgi:hypothetical protein